MACASFRSRRPASCSPHRHARSTHFVILTISLARLSHRSSSRTGQASGSAAGDGRRYGLAALCKWKDHIRNINAGQNLFDIS
ncbi:hypothetical protein DF058_09660 [Burkholderia cenocepacia]|nr:hypothetical protein DF058_09660 [Burkholderia cenocepacia]RRA16431.1 hypothetical protein DF059_09785 [Burkholderia cenocepacia]